MSDPTAPAHPAAEFGSRCPRCGVHHDVFADRWTAALGPHFCRKITAARARWGRQQHLAGLGRLARLRARLRRRAA